MFEGGDFMTTSVAGEMNNQLKKYLEGSGCGQLEIYSLHLAAGTEENRYKFVVRRAMSASIRDESVTAALTRLEPNCD
jgi:hypothetical protein